MPVHKIKSRHLSLISTAFGRRSFYQSSTTDSTKINRPGNNIRMYWPNFWWSTLHVQQIFLKKLLLKFVVHIFTLLLTPFCVQIGQSFEARWVFKHSEEFRNWRHFASIAAICRFSNILQRFTEPRKIDNLDAKGAKRSVEMWATNFYMSFSKIICCTWRVGCQKFGQYIHMLYPGRFILVESVAI